MSTSMSSMSRLVVLFLLFLLAAVMTACGNDSLSSGSSDRVDMSGDAAEDVPDMLADGGEEMLCPSGSGFDFACYCEGGVAGRLLCDASGAISGCKCPQGPDGRNGCGSEGRLFFGGEPSGPGDVCGECEDGTLVCEGRDRLRCLGGTDKNACGTCGRLTKTPGDPCGTCGNGAWTCESDGVGQPSGALICDGDDALNACGGCSVLDDPPFFPCVGEKGQTGLTACVAKEETRCILPGQNACGGQDDLGAVSPLDPCGPCDGGVHICSDLETITCVDEDEGVNVCGGCTILPANPSSPCSPCGGAWQCDGTDRVTCSAPVNACGGCTSLADPPGQVCSSGDPNFETACTTPDTTSCVEAVVAGVRVSNACGGATTLAQDPGSPCGACDAGTTICASTENTTCFDPDLRNPCGGCDPLSGVPGTSCGFNSMWTCGGSDGLSCLFVGPTNICGGYTAITNPPGKACRNCGEYVCDPLSGTTVCQGGSPDLMSDPNNCGGCGTICRSGEACTFGTCLFSRPVQIALSGQAFDGRDDHGCAVDDHNGIICWGSNNMGQLGDGTRVDSALPVRVQGIDDAVQVEVGQGFSCARRADTVAKTSRITCWGDNQRLALGRFTSTPQVLSPLMGGDVSGIDHAIDMVIAGTAVCVIEAERAGETRGRVICWGTTTAGGALFGNYDFSSLPISQYPEAVGEFGSIDDVIDLDHNGRSACAVREDGDVVCWGKDAFLGDSTQPTLDSLDFFKRIPSLSGATGVAVGTRHACAVDKAGSVTCWGRNDEGQLGRSSSTFDPRKVTDVTGAVSVDVGNAGSCALLSGLEAMCWGSLKSKGRGLSFSRSDQLSPDVAEHVVDHQAKGEEYLSAAPLKSIVDIVMNDEERQCVLLGDGQVRCWGTSGISLGDLQHDVYSLSLPRNRPVPVVGILPRKQEYGGCTNGIDDDGDGDTDCEDEECALLLKPIVSKGVYSGVIEDWGHYEAIPCLANGVHRETIRFAWPSPEAGTYRFSVNSSTPGQSNGAIAVYRGTCGGIPEACDGTWTGSIDVTAARDEILYIVVNTQALGSSAQRQSLRLQLDIAQVLP